MTLLVLDRVLYSHCGNRLISLPWLSMKEGGHLWLKTVQLEWAASFSPSLCHFSLSSGSRNSVKCTRDTMLIKTAAVCCLASGGRRASTSRRSSCWLATQAVRLHLQRPNLASIQALCRFLFWTLLSLHFSYRHSIRPFCVFHYFLIALSPLPWPHAQRKWTAPLSDGVRQSDLASLGPRLIDCPGVYLSHPLLPCILNQGPCNSSPAQRGLSHARHDSCQCSRYLSAVIYLFSWVMMLKTAYLYTDMPQRDSLSCCNCMVVFLMRDERHRKQINREVQRSDGLDFSPRSCQRVWEIYLFLSVWEM